MVYAIIVVTFWLNVVFNFEQFCYKFTNLFFWRLWASWSQKRLASALSTCVGCVSYSDSAVKDGCIVQFKLWKSDYESRNVYVSCLRMKQTFM